MRQICHPFQYVLESTDPFLELWPHRYDYIWAEHPQVGQRPDWKTESRHPLSDRLICQGSYLYGVRFGAQTNYCLLDIDVGSAYHPRRDSFAVPRILTALEPLGFVTHLACTSSYSGGIHLYFPFQKAQKSYQIAIAVQSLLENAGFQVVRGQLEVFPNPKLYRREGDPTLYAAHRLPLQSGSYLLELQGQSWDMYSGDRSAFVSRWRFAQEKNDVCSKILGRAVKTAKRVKYPVSGRADKFLNDLNTEIEAGWTGHGQTNFLLGRIAMRSYVFGHILYNCEPLVGRALIQRIVTIAQSLPGYGEYCRHQGEIEKRAEEWAICVENSHYFPYGNSPKGTLQPEKSDNSKDICSSQEEPQLTRNQERSLQARERIRLAIADLLEQGILPAGAKARFQLLTQEYRLGGETLYRHKDLWHPAHLRNSPPTPPTINEYLSGENAGGISPLKDTQSLLEVQDSNPLSSQALGEFSSQFPLDGERNFLSAVMVSEVVQDSVSVSHFVETEIPLKGPQDIRQLLLQIQERQKIERSHRQQMQPVSMAFPQRSEKAQTSYLERMERYLESNDPILVAEASAWFRANRS
ncbi:MAG: hypothetical protein SFW36_19840 [Leptolyngbyaceae cyanobacterium bins.59]|nr:hypothetical protein [Leptolyngbyaceae cyanobacterium bins.59]